jgi:tetratricopeptide (TPR) repeat protein
MQTVMKVSIAVSLVVALIVGGILWYTGGDLKQIGIPYNLFPKSEAPVEQAEEALGPKTGFEVSLKDGKSYLEEGFYDEAIKEFLVCLKEKPGHPEAKNGVASARFKRGEEYTNLEIFDKATEEYKKVLDFADPGSDLAKQAEDKIKRLSERLPK